MSSLAPKQVARLKRQTRVRKKITGSPARPRLNVFKSARHIYAQLIDDTTGVTLVAASTVMEGVAEGLAYTGNIEAAGRTSSTFTSALSGPISKTSGQVSQHSPQAVQVSSILTFIPVSHIRFY